SGHKGQHARRDHRESAGGEGQRDAHFQPRIGQAHPPHQAPSALPRWIAALDGTEAEEAPAVIIRMTGALCQIFFGQRVPNSAGGGPGRRAEGGLVSRRRRPGRARRGSVYSSRWTIWYGNQRFTLKQRTPWLRKPPK